MTQQHDHCTRVWTAGFTLVEVLAVLSILAIAGLAAVSYGGAGNKEPSARELARSIARAASQTALMSVSQGVSQSLIIDPGEGRVADSTQDHIIVVPDGVRLAATTAAEFAREDDRAEVVFFPDGSSTGGEIRVGDTHGRTYAVRIHWLTSAVTTGIVE